MVLPQITIARAHWALGALFLAIILEEYVPLLGADRRTLAARSTFVPWGLMVAGAGAWTTSVFADVVHDMLVHSLWGDILFVAGALELARRKGVYDRPWLDDVLPLTFVSCGALFLVHVAIHPTSQGIRWHFAMGLLLIAGGMLELLRLGRPRRLPIPVAVLPLSGFALALIAIPVAAAS